MTSKNIFFGAVSSLIDMFRAWFVAKSQIFFYFLAKLLFFGFNVTYIWVNEILQQNLSLLNDMDFINLEYCDSLAHNGR